MSDKFTFSEPFRSQLIRALKGHAPWKANYTPVGEVSRNYNPIPPTPKQVVYLKRLGAKKIPASKVEASAMIDALRNG